MNTKSICLLLLAVLFCGSISAQKKKPAAAKKPQATSKPAAKTISPSSFYNQPYASRNSGSFDKATRLISITYGFPNTLDYAGFLFGGNDTGIGPVTVRYEHPIREEAGVGLSIAGARKEWDFNDNTSTEVTGISVSPLGFYHFNKLIPVPKLDVYAGVGANVNYISYSYSNDAYDDDSEVEIYPTGLVGARYYFTNSFSGLVEVGGGSFGIAKIGVSFKL